MHWSKVQSLSGGSSHCWPCGPCWFLQAFHVPNGVSVEIHFRISSDTKWYTHIHTYTNIYKLDGAYTIRHVVYTISLRTLRTLGHTTYPTYTNISNLKVCPNVLNDPTADLNFEFHWSIFCRILLLDLDGEARLSKGNSPGGKSQIQKRDGIGWLGYHQYLVGGWPTPLKNMKVSWDDYSKDMEKQKMFQTTNHQYSFFKSTFFISSCCTPNFRDQQSCAWPTQDMTVALWICQVLWSFGGRHASLGRRWDPRLFAGSAEIKKGGKHVGI